MSGNIALNTLNTIYNNSFNQYLRYSSTIGGIIFEQSLTVNKVFKTTLELVQIFCKYRKPANSLAEQYLTDPLFQEIAEVRAFESKACDHVFQVTLVGKSIKIFEWLRESDAEKFVNKLHKYVQFYRQKAQCEIENLGRTHFEWLKHWSETYEELAVFIVNFFKNGITWSGISTLPLSHVLGDSQIVHKTQEHKVLLSEINKGEVIQNVLQHQPSSTGEVSAGQQLKMFEKQDGKWLIQNHKDNHKDLLLNTANKEDAICIYNCEDCTVVVENPVDVIRLDMCKRITVLCRNAVRGEAVDCKECDLHCFERISEVELLSCENCGLYLSDKSLDSSIITGRCIGIHVNFPFEDGLYHSFKISDQLKTHILPNKGVESVIK